jgi:hypothetical protein
MAATRRVDSAGLWISEQPSPTPQEPIVTAVAQQALVPKQSLPQVLNVIPIKLKHANDLLSAKNHSAAANAYRELYCLLTDTTHIQGLLYRSFCLQSLAYCIFRLEDNINKSLIISALADLQEALLKLESFTDADKQIQYYRAVKTHYEALTTWDNQCDPDLLQAKIQECDEKTRQLEMRFQIANQKTAPYNPKRVVLPLAALHDAKEFAEIFAHIQPLMEKYRSTEAGVHLLKFKERLKDPLDPQKLIWRAHCNIQLAECAYRGRCNLDPALRSKNQSLMNSLPSDAFEDLEAARQSLSSKEIISSDILRYELYQRLHDGYEELSRFEYWQTYAKAKELSQECLEQSQALSEKYLKFKIVFTFAIACLVAIIRDSRYHIVIKK